MAGSKKQDPNKLIPVEDYEHSGATRKNNPPVGLAHLDRDETRWSAGLLSEQNPCMKSSPDPYARLASLLWILKPADVARLVEVADGLAEQRLVAFLASAGSKPGQATLRAQERS